MDGAGPTVFERIEQKLSKMGIAVDNSDIREASRQVEASLEANPNDTESKINRLELKVVELARLLDASLGALESNGAAPQAAKPSRVLQHAAEPVEEEIGQAEHTEQAAQQAPKKVKKLMQNPATGIIEEVEVEDRPQDHFIVADGRGGVLPGRRLPANDDGPRNRKKSVFIAATDDEPVSAADPKRK
jgi:predicted RNA-binding protein Jag